MLERFSKLSGVELRASQRGGAADELVSVNVDNLPIGTAMDALWSLLSYKRANWRWNPTGSPTTPTYVLERPEAAQKLPQSFRNLVQSTYEREATALIKASLKTGKIRHRAVMSFVTEFLGGDPKKNT